MGGDFWGDSRDTVPERYLLTRQAVGQAEGSAFLGGVVPC